ncbi:MAG: site-specific integrase [Hyphomicrobium sp.]|uniref:tyrosine-type recombinase/integrase n=1 Tax=Hyphomicrobium sp. TaxID=82 RepID=UPI0039E6B30A
MARTATNVLVFNNLVVKQAIEEAKAQPQKEWRFERVLNPGKGGERRAPMPGLVLVTQPTGKGVFYKFYRNTVGKLKKLRLGDYDEIGLEGARKLWEDNSLSIAGGTSPVDEKHALRQAMTFKELAKALLANGKLAANTRANYERHLETHIYDVIGDKPCQSVTNQDVLAICRKAEAKSNFALSNMLKSIVGGVYRYGRNQGLCDDNPCLGIGRRGPKVARDRNPTGDEIAALWKAMDVVETQRDEDDDTPVAKLSPAMKLIIRLGIVTGQRRTEVAGVRRSELSDLDGKDPRWTIPGDVNKRGKVVEGRTKNGRTQIVPLSPLAVTLFKQALAECANREYLFPADATKTKADKPRTPHVHGESVSKAMRRLRVSAGIEDVSIHDMRRALSNYLKDNGVGREVRDLVLNHADGSVDGQHYSQDARMLTQVRAALELWSRRVERLVSDEADESSNVHELKRA